MADILTFYRTVESYATDIIAQHPHVSNEVAFAVAAQFAATEGAKKRVGLTEKQEQAVTEWVGANEFGPLSASYIFSTATNEPCSQSQANATGVLLQALGVARIKKPGRIRYFRAAN